VYSTGQDSIQSDGFDGDPLALLAEAVEVLGKIDPAELPDSVLADDVLGLRRLLDRGECVFARWAVVSHRRGVGARDGAVSTAGWLRTRAGMTQSRASRAIAAGEALEVMPATAAAWGSGEISADHAGWITQARVPGFEAALAAVEPTLVGHARRGELRELKAGLARIRDLTRPDSLHDERGFSLARTFRGAVVGELSLDAEGGEIVRKALDAYTDPPLPADDRTAAQRRADALVALCRVALDAGLPGRVSGSQVPHVSLILDHDTLAHGLDGRCELEHAGPVSPSTARRICCDAAVSRVVTDPDGIPLEVGRSRRTVPPPLRRAVVVRDRGCRFPGCDRDPARCQVHHVTHWADGGPTVLENLILVCSHHHHLLHEGRWHATFDGHTLHTHRPDRTELTHSALAA